MIPPPGAPRAAGPPGKHRRPRNVVLLGIFTLGVYMWVWWWKTSREIDAFARPAKSSHKMIRLYVIFSAIAFVFAWLMVAAVIAFVVQAAQDPSALETEEGPPAFIWVAYAAWFLIAFPLGIVGFVFLILGAYRLWDEIRLLQRRMGHRDPLNVALMFVLLLVPYVNLVGVWIMMYKTQDALNGIWARAGPARSATGS